MFQQTHLNLGEPLSPGDLSTVVDPRGIVLFAHADGGAHTGRRSVQAAKRFHSLKFCTLLFDLLTTEEAAQSQKHDDIDLLSKRLLKAIECLPPALQKLPLGLYGTDIGAAAALVAAAQRPQSVAAVVSRSGRLDTISSVLGDVRAPTLLIVGGADVQVVFENRQAFGRLRGEKRIDVIPRATRLFLEAGALDSTVQRAAEWFEAHLRPPG
jgi:putative phosphoribosyl transferase